MGEYTEDNGLVSIIIPAYNAAHYIETCLRSIYSQTYSYFEVIVAYDEKSTDDTLCVLTSLSEQYPHHIDIGRDTGSGAARNRGFQFAKGEFIIFVDADDELLPEYLSSMITLFTKYPLL